jgi:signal transduction histidine kinase
MLVEPFLRGTERVRTDHAGVGLGLAIIKSITQAHDGTLTLTPRGRWRALRHGAHAIAMFLPIASGIICSVGGRRSTDLGWGMPSVLVIAASLDRA